MNDLTCNRWKNVGERQYQCDVCEKSFNRKDHLTVHRRTHTGEKPYPCDICDKSFNNNTHLTVHWRTHTGEKPYPCDICDKSFSESGSLTKHRRTHTGEKPYPCDICDKSFSISGNLTIHRRTHTGEKPYPCDICDKSFSVSGTLTKHRRTHTGEKPYLCDICDKSFSVSCTLTKHRRIHTGEINLRYINQGLQITKLTDNYKLDLNGIYRLIYYLSVAILFINLVLISIQCANILHSDNGREFVNKVISELCSMWDGVKIVHDKPRHSQTQGSIERANQDLQNILRALMEDNNTSKWSESLPLWLDFDLSTKVTPRFAFPSKNVPMLKIKALF
ncbi:zinc finger protein 2 homolog [Acyrthosiphon pisum]|uniref:Uncharacterized protein n=1 Tax=Acyrthosiphon pisum TaxID=7029 RepID=A0A8R2NLF9_ACYPI|nr:zinc finger protein 2 homolog [Acyrthosiphon pisum]